MTNKYNHFFESVKDFVLKTNLSYPEDIKGLSEVAIDKLERKFKVSFPKALRSYYAFMGEKCEMIQTCDDLNFNEQKLQRARKDAKEFNVYEGIKSPIERYRVNIIKPKRTILLSDIMDLDDILFIRPIEHHGILTFINCYEEIPWFHCLTLGCLRTEESDESQYTYEYKLGNLSFIGHFRHVLFFAIQFKYGEISNYYDSELHQRVCIEELSWAKCYDKHLKKYSNFNVGSSRSYMDMRYEFSLEMDILSEETGIVMTIDEFEWAFIEHLRGLGVDI